VLIAVVVLVGRAIVAVGVTEAVAFIATALKGGVVLRTGVCGEAERRVIAAGVVGVALLPLATVAVSMTATVEPLAADERSLANTLTFGHMMAAASAAPTDQTRTVVDLITLRSMVVDLKTQRDI